MLPGRKDGGGRDVRAYGMKGGVVTGTQGENPAAKAAGIVWLLRLQPGPRRRWGQGCTDLPLPTSLPFYARASIGSTQPGARDQLIDYVFPNQPPGHKAGGEGEESPGGRGCW